MSDCECTVKSVKQDVFPDGMLAKHFSPKRWRIVYCDHHASADKGRIWCKHMLWSKAYRGWYLRPAGADSYRTQRELWVYCPICGKENPNDA